MNFDDEHEVIVNLKKQIGGTFADKITDDDISASFLHMDPAARAEALMRIDAHAAAVLRH